MTSVSKLAAIVAIGALFGGALAMAQALPSQEGNMGSTQGARDGSAAGTNANSNPSGSNHEMGKSSMGQTSNTGNTTAANPQGAAANKGGQGNSNSR